MVSRNEKIQKINEILENEENAYLNSFVEAIRVKGKGNDWKCIRICNTLSQLGLWHGKFHYDPIDDDYTIPLFLGE